VSELFLACFEDGEYRSSRNVQLGCDLAFMTGFLKFAASRIIRDIREFEIN